jgi:hypothetical protein
MQLIGTRVGRLEAIQLMELDEGVQPRVEGLTIEWLTRKWLCTQCAMHGTIGLLDHYGTTSIVSQWHSSMITLPSPLYFFPHIIMQWEAII